MVRPLAAVLLALLLGFALVGPLLAPDPYATDVARVLAPPSCQSPFGTDALGRDLMARVVHGARLDLGLALAATVIAVVIGVPVGIFAGWRGGWLERLTGWGTDILLALPIYLLAMVLAGGLGNSVEVAVLATAMVNLPFFIRLSRTEIARLRRSPIVDAMRMGGASERDILSAVAPRLAPLIVVQATTTMGWAILNMAGLSFLGLGLQPPQPEWGVLVSEGARWMASGHWWLTVFPGAALMLSVLGFHLTGDALRTRWQRPIV